MDGRRDGSRFLGVDLVELGIQDVLDPLVGVDARRKSTTTGSFETLRAVAAGEAEEAQAGTIGLLRMLARGQEGLHELGSVWANGLCPTCEPLGRPLLVVLMSGRHVFGEGRMLAGGVGAPMRRDAVVVEKDLHRVLCGAHVDLFVDESMRDAVEYDARTRRGSRC